MKSNLITTALAMGLAIVGALPTHAQDFGEEDYRRMPTSYNLRYPDINLEEYEVFMHEMQEGERLRDLQPFLRSRYDSRYGYKLERILNTRERLFEGDKITVIEAQTPEGIFYPYYVHLDYSDSEREDIEVVASMVAPEQDADFRFTLNYHNFQGRRHMILWNNKRNPGFFQARGPYTNIAKFIMPGERNKYRMTSGFGERQDPFGNATGGSSTTYHSGEDLVNRDLSNVYDEEILAPMEGFVRFGYIQHVDTVRGTTEDEKSLGRYIEFKSDGRVPVMFQNGNIKNSQINYVFLHSRAGSEELLRESLPEGVTEWWWNRTLYSELDSEFSEEDLIENIRNNYEAGRLNQPGVLTEWVPVSQDDVIGRVGNTGRKTGIHLHYEIHINHVPVDPSIFQEYNRIIQDYTLQQMREEKRRIEYILRNN